ncbi:MAG TPA: SDR family NAD(P)-dependent oxidoreductase, partial [Flavobacteriales bacterium]|nr:SDR family NAD(P)-dependent oxidoreductase [Flavobacteriales bacterium]
MSTSVTPKRTANARAFADRSALEALFSVNTLGPLRLLRAFLPHGRGGFFVSLSGVVAEAPLLGLSAYAASKAALSLATRAAAMESRRHDIDVIDARPPHTETGLATRPLAGRAPRL